MLFKLSNLNSNLALILGYLNPALNNSAQEFREPNPLGQPLMANRSGIMFVKDLVQFYAGAVHKVPDSFSCRNEKLLRYSVQNSLREQLLCVVVIADDTFNDIQPFRSTTSKLTTKANKKDTGTETISMLILKS